MEKKSGGIKDKEVNKAALADPLFLTKFKEQMIQVRRNWSPSYTLPKNQNGGSGDGKRKGEAKLARTCNNCRRVGHNANKC